MLRRIPTYVLLAAFVTSGSALAARTTKCPGRRQSHQRQPPENPRRRPLAVRARSPLRRR